MGAGTGGPAGPALKDITSAAEPLPHPLALGIVRGLCRPARDRSEAEPEKARPVESGNARENSSNSAEHLPASAGYNCEC